MNNMNKKTIRKLVLLQKMTGMLDFTAVQEDNVPRNQILQNCLLILTYL